MRGNAWLKLRLNLPLPSVKSIPAVGSEISPKPCTYRACCPFFSRFVLHEQPPPPLRTAYAPQAQFQHLHAASISAAPNLPALTFCFISSASVRADAVCARLRLLHHESFCDHCRLGSCGLCAPIWRNILGRRCLHSLPFHFHFHFHFFLNRLFSRQ